MGRLSWFNDKKRISDAEMQYGRSALRVFCPLDGEKNEDFGCANTRCSLKIELCDKLEPLEGIQVSLSVFESFKIVNKSRA
jgi:hypothetical protein